MQTRDITEATFQAEVVTASHTRPVVVDFWAPWCAPCRQLSPLLDRAAERWAGVVDVVKLNVDQAQEVARRYGVQGIPAVKAFKDGKVAREFVGAQPEPAITAFFEALAPTEADRLTEQAAQAPPVEREELYRKALAEDAGHARATVGLASALVDRGDTDEAIGVLERLPGDPEVQQLLARIRLQESAGEDLEALRERAERGHPDARLALGRALAGRGEHDQAIDTLLAAVGHPDTREPAREALVQLFTVMEDDDPLVLAGRRRLSAALY